MIMVTLPEFLAIKNLHSPFLISVRIIRRVYGDNYSLVSLLFSLPDGVLCDAAVLPDIDLHPVESAGCTCCDILNSFVRKRALDHQGSCSGRPYISLEIQQLHISRQTSHKCHTHTHTHAHRQTHTHMAHINATHTDRQTHTHTHTHRHTDTLNSIPTKI